MDGNKTSRPWGKLVKLDSCDDELLLINRECTVGRKRGCDLSFPSNKFVSGVHCKIAHDESSGLVWLEDTSTNGTVINMLKVIKKQTHELQNGDVIHIVYRKNEPHENVAYVFHFVNSEQETSHITSDISSPIGPSDMALSVSPVLLTKPPQGLDQDDPLPADFCISPALTVQASTSHAATGQHRDPDTTGVDRNDLEPECKKRKMNEDVPHTSSTDPSGPKAGGSVNVVSKPQAEASKTDKMEESLTCIICQDLLYDCISLQPCMHTFCAACYSGWMERSSQCPTCRCRVERIRKNHILNNLVEAFLLQHPEKCRSEEDRKSMDSRNKITADMRQPIIEGSYSEDSDYLYDFSDNDSDSSDNSHSVVKCRQCPGYRSDISHVLVAPGSGNWIPVLSNSEQPSTSTDVSAVPQPYTCPPFASHLFCACCFQPMPDRRSESNTTNNKVEQQCTICLQYFCHMYWQCSRVDCHGCLARFTDLNLTDKCLDGVFNNNNYETEILQNYLSAQGKTWRDILQESLQGLQEGSYSVSDPRISAQTVLCFGCGRRNFRELVYQYRVKIPASDLPSAVTSRPDCYWGRNCRTQVKAHHARNFNHICEQTRFKS